MTRSRQRRHQNSVVRRVDEVLELHARLFLVLPGWHGRCLAHQVVVSAFFHHEHLVPILILGILQLYHDRLLRQVHQIVLLCLRLELLRLKEGLVRFEGIVQL